MPYNNVAIPQSVEPTGTTALPLARVKKIMQADEDIGPVSNNAAFVICLATEMFVRYFAEKSHEQARAEAKPRRNIQYKDLANAVARLDNLEFLSDIVPRTTTWREHQAKKARESGEAVPRRTHPLPAGQRTLDGRSNHFPDPNSSQDTMLDDGEVAPLEAQNEPGFQILPGLTGNGDARTNGNGLVFKHYDPSGPNAHLAREDEEMH